VLARIRLGGQTPIKEDTQAKLALTGITGTSIIQLSGGTPQSPKLKGKDGKLPPSSPRHRPSRACSTTAMT
jgi:phospholipid/cholesterol/gamma-HCH transport system substrate-binding protein